MLIIVISVAAKGPTVEPSLRGDPKKRWSIIESGLTEAIGVISPYSLSNPAIWNHLESHTRTQTPDTTTCQRGFRFRICLSSQFACVSNICSPSGSMWSEIADHSWRSIPASVLIYGSLKTPTLDRFARVIHVSTALSVLACLVMSFSGFLTFTDRTQAYVPPFPRQKRLMIAPLTSSCPN